MMTDDDVARFARQLFEATSKRVPGAQGRAAPDGSYVVASLLEEKRWRDVVRIIESIVAHASGH